MSDNESRYNSEPNAFDGESSDDQTDTRSEALSFDSVDSEDNEVEIIGERVRAIPSVGKGKVLPTDRAVPCCVNYASTSQY